MKTRYRFIHFEQDHDEWLCYTNRGAEILGYCEYHKPWKQWQFSPFRNTAYTSDCCRDIAHFLDQLKAQPLTPPRP